jgi:calcium-dependent protein kinase
VLGTGGFGIVKLAKLKNYPESKKSAIKIIEKKRIETKMYMLLRELEILKTLDHPNIVKFHEIYEDPMFFYICMEYCSGGELLTKITKKRYFKEKEAGKIM